MARVESVAKAARILHAFDPERRTLTVRELASRSGCPRSTCHAICATLVDEQLLERVPGGGYRLGPALAEMGGQVIERTGLVEAATPSMRGLSRAVGGEVHLGQLVGRFVIYLIRIEHERRLPMRNRMGLRAPAHLTGCGKAALAQLDPVRVRGLLAGEPGSTSIGSLPSSPTPAGPVTWSRTPSSAASRPWRRLCSGPGTPWWAESRSPNRRGRSTPPGGGACRKRCARQPHRPRSGFGRYRLASRA